MKADAKQRVVEVERKQKAIHEKLDRLDEAFLYERTIDIERYDRQRDKLREELTLVQMDRGHAPPSSKNSTWKASWRSLSAFYRARRTCGCSRR
jgi:hypothetical protein